MKPVPSSSAAPAAMLAVTPSVPGTGTDAGALTGGPCASAKETAHGPAPPPASASETEIVLLSPAFSSPNETLDGEAKRSGAFARTRLMRPPPPRRGVAGQHQRRLDLRDRPGWMLLPEQRGGACNVRRRHARAAERRPGALPLRDGRNDAHAGSRNVRLQLQGIGSRPDRREGRDDVRREAASRGRRSRGDRQRGAAG